MRTYNPILIAFMDSLLALCADASRRGTARLTVRANDRETPALADMAVGGEKAGQLVTAEVFIED